MQASNPLGDGGDQGGCGEQEHLSQEGPSETTADQPDYRAAKGGFRGPAPDDVVGHNRKRWIDEDEQENGGDSVDNRGEHAGGQAQSRVEIASIERGED